MAGREELEPGTKPLIPRALVAAWRRTAPWPDEAQVEQDLVLCRALADIYRRERIASRLAFRGGTALHKLVLPSPLRYSEDLDLVQYEQGPVGELVDAVREALDDWLGEPTRKLGQEGTTLTYRFDTTSLPRRSMRLKVEINTREHGSLLPLLQHPWHVDSDWYRAHATVAVYSPAELLATKLRALFQRNKGRDLFDLAMALERLKIDPEEIVVGFLHYTAGLENRITRARFEANLAAKCIDPSFRQDLAALLPPGVPYDFDEALARVRDALVCRIPGAPWRGPSSKGAESQ